MRTYGAPQESNKDVYILRLNIQFARMYPGRFLHVGLLAAVVVMALVGVACLTG